LEKVTLQVERIAVRIAGRHAGLTRMIENKASLIFGVSCVLEPCGDGVPDGMVASALVSVAREGDARASLFDQYTGPGFKLA
jgi:hypothetical protein